MNPDYREVRAEFDFRYRDVLIDVEYLAGPEVTARVVIRGMDSRATQVTLHLTTEQAERLGKRLE